MLNDNQVWENKTKVAKLEQSDEGMHALVFNIKTDGLEFSSIVSSKDHNLETFLKKSRMHPTNKILTVSE